MVLPTNCDEAPRLGTNLQPRFCRWASADSTACAIDSMLLAWKDRSIYWCDSLFVCQGRVARFLLKRRNTWSPYSHMLLYLLGLVQRTSNPQTTAGCQGTWGACPQTDRMTAVAWLLYKLCRRCLLIEQTEVSGYLCFRTKVSSIKHRTRPSILITSTHFFRAKIIKCLACLNIYLKPSSEGRDEIRFWPEEESSVHLV